ncbi:MAG: hypothetical protein V1724_08260 [Chloroflexota bacterium]
MAAALLGAWDYHPIRVGFRPAWLGQKEMDVIGVKCNGDIPTEILIVEAKGRATTDQELQAHLQDFENKLNLVCQNAGEVVRGLARLQPLAQSVPVRGIFVSMADLGRFQFKHGSNIELWDLEKFLSHLRQAKIPRNHINLLRQEVSAQEIASLDDLVSLDLGQTWQSLRQGTRGAMLR